MLPVNSTGSYTEDEPNFPRQNNLILQKRCLVETRLSISATFQDLIKKLRTFQGPKPDSRQPVFKIQDLFKIVLTMLAK